MFIVYFYLYFKFLSFITVYWFFTDHCSYFSIIIVCSWFIHVCLVYYFLFLALTSELILISCLLFTIVTLFLFFCFVLFSFDCFIFYELIGIPLLLKIGVQGVSDRRFFSIFLLFFMTCILSTLLFITLFSLGVFHASFF